MGRRTASDHGVVLEQLRALLLGIVAIGMAGTTLDLLLLEHYEDPWQIAPLAMLALGLVVVGWAWRSGTATAIRAMRIAMAVFLVTGAVGVFLHYRGNTEFQHEMDPTLQGWALFFKVMRAKAPPALAPMAIVQIGLLGLLYTFRHAALQQASRDARPISQENP